MSESIVRRKAAAERLGISLSSLWRYEQAGLLPPARRFGPNVSGWLNSEFEAALKAMPERTKGVAA